MAINKTSPKIAIDLRTIPNYKMFSNLIRDEGGEISPELLEKKIDEVGRLENGLPIPYYQKICACSLVFEKDKKKQVVSFTGDEVGILKFFWNTFLSFCDGKSVFPTLIMGERNNLLMQIITARSHALHALCKIRGFKEPKLKNDFFEASKDVMEGLAILENSSDKWEKSRPNYLYPYSNYVVSLNYSIGRPSINLRDTSRTASLVSNEQFEKLADFSAREALNIWENFRILEDRSGGKAFAASDIAPSREQPLTSLKHTHFTMKENPYKLFNIGVPMPFGEVKEIER